jgi:hypothetical protein
MLPRFAGAILSTKRDRDAKMPTVKTYLGLARKYKAMGLPVQRFNAVKDALYWRRVHRHS